VITQALDEFTFTEEAKGTFELALPGKPFHPILEDIEQRKVKLSLKRMLLQETLKHNAEVYQASKTNLAVFRELL